MLGQLKRALDQALEKLDDLNDALDERLDDVDDDLEQLWQGSQRQLGHLKAVLSEASTKAGQFAHTAADETELQTHLATMDAKMRWRQVQQTLHPVMAAARREVGQEIDHAKLQAHLARMDAEGFLTEESKLLRQEYLQAKQTVRESSLRAATDIQKQFEGFIDGLPRM